MSRRSVGGLVLGAVALVGATVGITLAVTSTPSPPPSASSVVAPPTQCQPDPSAVIAALPAGAEWTGSGCYFVPSGLAVLTSHVINCAGGSLVETNTTTPMKPVVSLRANNSGVVNCHLYGQNSAGTYHSSLVAGAGIKTFSASNITIANDQIYNTFGDGLEFWFGASRAPTQNVTVNHVTVTAAGRHGMTPGDVINLSVNDLQVLSQADDGIDFESDVKGTVTQDVSISNSYFRKLYLQTMMVAPITFTNDIIFGHVVYQGNNPDASVLISGGSLNIPFLIVGTPNAGILLNSPSTLTFSHVQLTRVRPVSHVENNQGGRDWLAQNGHLVLVCTPSPPKNSVPGSYEPPGVVISSC